VKYERVHPCKGVNMRDVYVYVCMYVFVMCVCVCIYVFVVCVCVRMYVCDM
jgi:hypothetical protein